MAQWHSTRLGIGNPGFSLGLAQAGIPSHREMVSYNMTALYSHWDGHKGKAVDKEEGNQSSAALLDCKTAQALRTACFPKTLNTDIL